MITGFENITEPLSAEDLWLSKAIISGLVVRTKDRPIKGSEIVKSINEKYHLECKFTEVNDITPGASQCHNEQCFRSRKIKE